MRPNWRERGGFDETYVFFFVILSDKLVVQLTNELQHAVLQVQVRVGAILIAVLYVEIRITVQSDQLISALNALLDMRSNLIKTGSSFKVGGGGA